MKKMKILFIAFFLSAGCASVFAQVGLNKLAQSTMNFLLVGTSPRASAMGEAFFAVGSGAESIFYNPAGMVRGGYNYDVTMNYTQWIADINYLSGAFSWNLGNYGSVGVSILTVDYGTINGTSLILPSQSAIYPAGYIDNGAIDNVGAYAVGLTYSRQISEQFSIGGTMRYVGQSLGTNNFINGEVTSNDAAKLVFDAGVMYNTGFKNFRFGMAIRNFSSQIKREEIDEQLPLTFNLGTAIDIIDFILPDHDAGTGFTLAMDYLHSNNYSERVNIGTEFKLLDMLYLRGGFQSNRDIASWSGGLGIEKSLWDYKLKVNYSFSQMEIFDSINRLSVGFQF